KGNDSYHVRSLISVGAGKDVLSGAQLQACVATDWARLTIRVSVQVVGRITEAVNGDGDFMVITNREPVNGGWVKSCRKEKTGHEEPEKSCRHAFHTFVGAADKREPRSGKREGCKNRQWSFGSGPLGPRPPGCPHQKPTKMRQCRQPPPPVATSWGC